MPVPQSCQWRSRVPCFIWQASLLQANKRCPQLKDIPTMEE